ncbi:MAG: helix-turn-helix domain-containing protein [Verrucomicrobia bacterium]|nr:helix-turn-helix domain-containing protein [Verrucomicrobiota bacterium]MCH8527046.1 helix-turn-helix domain-containing protein [Kiritimatiellia bacterium]
MNQNIPYLVAVVDRQMVSHVEIWRGLCGAADRGEWPHAIEELNRLHRHLDARSCLGMICWVWKGFEFPEAFPVINLSNARGPLPECGNLLNDDVEVGRIAAKHLLRNGYSEYLTIGIHGQHFSTERIQGFSETVRNQKIVYRSIGLPALKDWAPDNRWNPQAYMDAMAECLAPYLESLQPDAGIFAIDHPIAQHVEHCLYRYFPERVHTTGLLAGDLPVAYRWLPGARRSISCVQTANAAKGRAAMEWFIQPETQRGPVTDLCRFFPPEGVIAKASTAGPACGHPVLALGIRWAWQRIQSGFPPSVEEFAACLNMSSRSLNRLFREELNESARTFLLNLRMERAAQILRAHPERSIQQVAAESGFTNQGAFSGAFRNWSGRQPRDYRREVQSVDRPDAYSGKPTRMR